MLHQIRSVKKAGPRRGGSFLFRPIRGRLLAPIVLCFVQILNPRACAGQGDSVDEYKLKAAMLYNLMHFVEWPDSAYPDPRAPIRLCTLGRDPLEDYLTATIPQETANGRAVLIRHLQNDKEARACQVLYISSSERKTTAHILSTLNGSCVLTVGEMTQFAARGGMIQFSLDDQKVRFDINLEAASQAGLKISSKLLALAQIVKN